MGFPKSIRDQALIAAARHCCVCHRYNGVKVEVHHIQPEESGGLNTFENAIALCFDCHADAGHYNPNHPRGTKFSPVELTKARDSWYTMVKENNIQEYAKSENFYCRYFVCKNYESLLEIAKNDLERFPVENPLLINNSVLEMLRKIISYHKYDYRRSGIWGESFPSVEKYLEAHPDAQFADKVDASFSYYKTIRTPSLEELKENCEKEDGLVRLLLENGIPSAEISIVAGYRDECGGVPFQEEYIFRPLWCSFLAITNLKEYPVTIDSIQGELVEKESASIYKRFKIEPSDITSISLPKAPIPPNATVLVPLGLILAPLHTTKIDVWSQEFDGRGRVQEVAHCGLSSEDLEDFNVLGTQILPAKVLFKENGQEAHQEVHNLDLSNMYTIDRFWEMGSCPHLFFVGNEISYSRELLAKCQLIEGLDYFSVPERISTVIIAELEEEKTEIRSIKVDGVILVENRILKKGDVIEIDVSPKMVIEVTGMYIPEYSIEKRDPTGQRRNEIVCDFLNQYLGGCMPNKKLHA